MIRLHHQRLQHFGCQNKTTHILHPLPRRRSMTHWYHCLQSQPPPLPRHYSWVWNLMPLRGTIFWPSSDPCMITIHDDEWKWRKWYETRQQGCQRAFYSQNLLSGLDFQPFGLCLFEECLGLITEGLLRILVFTHTLLFRCFLLIDTIRFIA